MELFLKRNHGTTGYTAGRLYQLNQFECYTLEDQERPHKIPGETAIPTGKYQVVVTFSNRFQKPLPLLLAVPGFSGVRIHSGNTAADTEGCILVGANDGNPGDGWLGRSREAFTALFAKIQAAIAAGEKVWITIT
ncbi:DUF5675 family protein [Nitrosospira sp. Nsp1]|uniref:DUF5675 family protein n=1 Tax=Nitrosospira sp. Nsp1 TaxID=136547 RepID=UPI00088F7695|nr:DUF5675 family protein [Nitrosospira sp. Nsp1]SCX40363.1 hypothetical protein SAMN05720354_10397 [Nitrosospira sp. Nsp1]